MAPKQYDYVFVSGDIADLPNSLKVERDKENVDSAMVGLKKLLEEDLEPMSKNGVIYIPGNHDPMALYDKKPELSANSKNIHGSWEKLNGDLVVAGLGGCVQNFVSKENDEGPLTPCWDPYPYGEEDHSRFNQELDTLWQSLPTSSQLIVMTHDGPSGSSTAKNVKFDQNMITYHAGSPHLTNLLV